MPLFRYNGYKESGAQATGTIEAGGLQDAISGIKQLGIYPREVSEYHYEEKRRFFRRYGNSLLPHLTRQLSILLSSGVPLIDALRSLSEENTGFWKGLLVRVRDGVAGGSGLSRALEANKGVFPDYYIQMVAAGEQSGSLDRVLNRVADFLEKQAIVRAKIRTAMVYPLFMAFVGFVVLSFLFTFVVPKIVRIFEHSKSALPVITVVLITISNLFINYWWLLGIAAAVLIFLLRRLQQNHRHLIDGIKLKAPGGVLQSLYFGRFARTLGFLLDGGLPMLRALELSSRSVGNTILAERIMAAAQKVAGGGSIASSLEGFPSVLLQLISTGERSGTMVEILNKAADTYEEEFERKTQKALTLLEPSMILLMGLIVGFIVLAILLPMFQLNQLVK